MKGSIPADVRRMVRSWRVKMGTDVVVVVTTLFVCHFAGQLTANLLRLFGLYRNPPLAIIALAIGILGVVVSVHICTKITPRDVTGLRKLIRQWGRVLLANHQEMTFGYFAIPFFWESVIYASDTAQTQGASGRDLAEAFTMSAIVLSVFFFVTVLMNLAALVDAIDSGGHRS